MSDRRFFMKRFLLILNVFVFISFIFVACSQTVETKNDSSQVATETPYDGHIVSVDELEDFINSITTTDVVKIRVIGSGNSFSNRNWGDLFKNENLKIDLDLSLLEGEIISMNLRDWKSLVKLTCPKNLKYFYINRYCSNLESIIFPNPNTLEIVELGKFQSLKNLKTVVLPNSVTEIEAYAFSGCENLKNITLPDSLKIIGEKAFSNSGLDSITLPKSIKSIATDAFDKCRLKRIIISSGITELPDGVFKNCEPLEITLPETLKTIGDEAFAGVGVSYYYNVVVKFNYQNIVIPSSVETIGKNAFRNQGDYLKYALEEKAFNITFKNKKGWKAGETPISESDLSDPVKAAEYLTNTYCDQVWTRSDN